ncbi:unnamed protein product [Fraxinus pennsylvanica]|uniref:Uricase n=1 Tax=Fraxinus pennsylvanica TaxID=56036 RepID=A0AAD2DQ24_9LAMI|nr:unnamed protein product [Fraxinus pennsylvanica]
MLNQRSSTIIYSPPVHRAKIGEVSYYLILSCNAELSPEFNSTYIAMATKNGDSIGGLKLEQRHGKSRVRVGRVWKDENGRHHFVEWNVSISLLSDCLPAYVNADNSDIVATDTMKNTVKAAIIKIVEKPWERIHIDGQPHEHATTDVDCGETCVDNNVGGHVGSEVNSDGIEQNVHSNEVHVEAETNEPADVGIEHLKDGEENDAPIAGENDELARDEPTTDEVQ